VHGRAPDHRRRQHVLPFSTVGLAPQDLKYKGERSETRIGDRNRIREFVTIHRGTEGGGMVTSVGDDNLLMAYVHVAHDVQTGSNIVFGHGATLGGHVIVEDWAVISAGSAVHQYCRIGRHSIVGGYSVITQDVLPYSMTVSEREVHVFGANKTGLERRGVGAGTIDDLHKAFRLLTKSGLNTSQALERIEAEIPPPRSVTRSSSLSAPPNADSSNEPLRSDRGSGRFPSSRWKPHGPWA